jgi:hypothetical protein
LNKLQLWRVQINNGLMTQTTNIPEIFKSEDTVYHYTTTETALNFILRDKKIRLSPRNNSIDP